MQYFGRSQNLASLRVSAAAQTFGERLFLSLVTDE